MRAYERGDYQTAFRTLKPIVYDHAARNNKAAPDPWAAFYLARMIQRGEGTTNDPALACAMFRWSAMEFLMRLSDWWEPRVAAAKAAAGDACAAFPDYSNDEERALETTGFLDGIVRSEFTLDAGNWTVVDRTGIHVTIGNGQKDWPLPSNLGVTLPVRHTTIAVQHGTRMDHRHFLEFFSWVSYAQAARIHRELHWIIVEVAGSDLQIRSDQTIAANWDAPYPSTDANPEISDSVELRATDGGEVEWIMVNEQKRGIIR